MKENSETNWTMCMECQGRGKKNLRLRKKIRLQYQQAVIQFEKSEKELTVPIRPKGHLASCSNCSGTGLIRAAAPPLPDTENYPHVAIIGGGIGGMALAVACLHRGIPFTLYERDKHFTDRSQGYGLTLQQASKAIRGLGIVSLNEGLISTRHVVHTPEGNIIGEWGMRKWLQTAVKSPLKRTNIHIARQSLRMALLKQLDGQNVIKWNHQLIEIKENNDNNVELCFQVEGELKWLPADLVVGADGIRSTLRKFLINDEISPLRYLGCMVILGICPLKSLEELDSSLLDSATVFQTANGHERIYIMPFTSDSVMWQLSFPMAEVEAKALSAQGAKALKEEACRRIRWHEPIPQIVSSTLEAQISGYPVYDRELLNCELLKNAKQCTLIGDAAHPMSPFKGQGANQALLDALSLARAITIACRPNSKWHIKGIRESVLTEFEQEMVERSASKVHDSAEAAAFLHSEIVLTKSNEPRGSCVKRNNENNK